MKDLREQIISEIKEELAEASIQNYINTEMNFKVNNLKKLSESKNYNNTHLILEELSNIITLNNEELFLKLNKEEYLQNLIKVGEKKFNLTENHFEFELYNSSELLIEDLQYFKKFTKLTEMQNETEVIEIIKNNLSNFKLALEELVSTLKNFNINYIGSVDEAKYLSIGERKIAEQFKSAFMSSSEVILNIFHNKFLFDYNSISNEENRKKAIEIFLSFKIAIKNILISTVALRILMGNNFISFEARSCIDSLYDKNCNISLIQKMFCNFEKENSIYDKTRLMSKPECLKNLDPIYDELFFYILGTNENKHLNPSEVSDLFIKRMSLSGKYVHHIHQLIISSNDISLTLIKFINKLLTKPLKDALDGDELNDLNRLALKLQNDLECLKSDIKCAEKTSAVYLSNEFTKKISTSNDSPFDVWNMYSKITRNRFNFNQ